MPVVDVCFPIQLRSVARDHGYILFGAISRAIPALHSAQWLGIHTFEGRLIDEGVLDLGRRPLLRLRLPAERIADVLPLSGSVLDVAGTQTAVGVPTIYPLIPSPSLDARMVAIKLTRAPRRENPTIGRQTLDVDAFRRRYSAEIERQLGLLDIRKPFDIRGRTSLAVAKKRVIAFAVRVSDLSETESLRLMERGIGGRRHMGCGLFRPARET